jgi:DNA-binding transcriptional regulator YdaS (Cro superfamily)
MSSRAAIEKAVQILGSQKALAAALAKFMDRPTISQQTISYWINNETALEAEWWGPFEHVTAGKVTRQMLRSEIFARPARSSARRSAPATS